MTTFQASLRTEPLPFIGALRKRTAVAFGLLLGLYVLVMWMTSTTDFGDTIYYVDEILKSNSEPPAAAKHTLFEFGHLLWRPLGWILFQVVSPFARPDSPEQARLLITKLLVGVGLLSSAVTALLMFSILLRLKMRIIPSFAVCISLVCSNAILNTSHAGSSYATALTFLVASLWMLIRPGIPEHHKYIAWIAGVFLALSFLIWFPFVLAVPAVALAAATPWGRAFRMSSLRLAFTAQVLLACFTVSILTYGGVMYVLDIRNIQDALGWVRSSSHGLRKTVNFLRIGMAARCCIAVGEQDGIIWKRFLFHDPYARVTFSNLLLGSNLPKLALFYGSFTCLGIALLRSRQGRFFLSLLTVAAVPTIIFSIFLYEPSSIERFMPIFPFLFLALAFQLSAIWFSWKWKTIGIFLLLAMTLVNASSLLGSRVEAQWVPTTARARSLKQSVPPGSVVMLLGNQDKIHYLVKDRPLDKEYPNSLALLDVLQLGTDRVLHWQNLFSEHVLNAWETQKDVWISDRLRASSPRPEWNWVEGDDRAIQWRQLPKYFNRFEYDQKIGGEDGFTRLAQSARNRALLEPAK